jgi:hypothetical protein
VSQGTGWRQPKHEVGVCDSCISLTFFVCAKSTNERSNHKTQNTPVTLEIWATNALAASTSDGVTGPPVSRYDAGDPVATSAPCLATGAAMPGSHVLWDSASHNTSNVVDAVARDSTFAIVTFTSRKVAIATRHCLADGRAVGRWTSAEEIPVPPLADGAPFAVCPCRGC